MQSENEPRPARVRRAGDAALILDDFLSAERAADLWRYVQGLPLNSVHHRGYEKVFRLYDGECLIGPSHQLALQGAPAETVTAGRARATNALSHLIFEMLGTPAVRTLLDACAPWRDLAFSSYIFPPGSGLGWHTDTGKAAAFIYYVHPAWHESWGGELLIEDAPNEYDAPPAAGAAAPFRDFYRAFSDPGARSCGFGTFIAPTPNRLIIIRGGTRHSIKKVESAAGEAFRATISASLWTMPAASTVLTKATWAAPDPDIDRSFRNDWRRAAHWSRRCRQ